MRYIDYVDLRYKPKEDDVICDFYIEPFNISFKEAVGGVAAESSIGTWTEVMMIKPRILKMAAKVFEIRNNRIKIAYPIELFETGNIPQILSSVSGNIFGMKIIKNLRLENIYFPRQLVKSFKGPELGLEDIRKITKIKDRPLLGTIFKPKLGLTAKEMADNAYIVYTNGIDWTKDDENLTSMKFNKFEDRVIKMLDVIDKIKSEQGRDVIYAANVTSALEIMLKRAQFIKDHGGKCAMIDILTVGWSALQAFRKQNFKLIIHAHRASHAALTRNKKHGVSMLALAKIARLIGVSTLHTGTVVGKMESSEAEVIEINKFLQSNWYGIKSVMPVASGGLHPALLPQLVEILGRNLIINCGGGLWGHPVGIAAGAKAIKQAMDATIQGISLREYAKSHEELRAAIEYWV